MATYKVEKILDKKVDRTGTKYLLKWEGYPESESTWEPSKNLLEIKHLIEEYENDCKIKKMEKKEVESTKKKKGSRTKEATIRSDSCNSIMEEAKLDLVENDDFSTRVDTSSQEKIIRKINLSNKTTNKSEVEVDGNLCYDIPHKIVDAKTTKQNGIQCFVEWKPRYDKTVPNNSYVSNSELKKNFPHLLLEFYESKII